MDDMPSEIELPTTWGTIRGKSFGNGKCKILAVHGWLDNANSFDKLLKYLKGDFTVVAIDLPGHGKSDHFEKSFIYEPKCYVMAIKKAVRCLGWTTFTYLGHSMGAVVGIMYCAIYPEDIEGFISIDIIKPWSTDPQQYHTSLRKYCDSYIKNEELTNNPPLVCSKEELVKKTVDGSRGSLDEASAELLLERGARPADEGSGLILTRDLRAKAYFIGFYTIDSWIGFAHAITAPVLIIQPESGHIYDTEETYEKMVRAFETNSKHYQHHSLEGRHHVHMTHPQTVGEIMQDFLDVITSS